MHRYAPAGCSLRAAHDSTEKTAIDASECQPARRYTLRPSMAHFLPGEDGLQNTLRRLLSQRHRNLAGVAAFSGNHDFAGGALADALELVAPLN